MRATTLAAAERARLHTLIGCEEAPARMLTLARILLRANQGEGGPWLDGRHDRGGEGPRREYRRTLDGVQEARPRTRLRYPARPAVLDAAPAGRGAGRAGAGEAVPYETMRQVLKQTNCARI